jgi:hypothetical protein
MRGEHAGACPTLHDVNIRKQASGEPCVESKACEDHAPILIRSAFLGFYRLLSAFPRTGSR